VAVGCGWQATVAYINVGCYYLIGIPLGCILGFKFGLGVQVAIFIGPYKSIIVFTSLKYIYVILYTGNMVGNDRRNNVANSHFIMDHTSNWLG